jgi:hypothetical protein
MEGLVLNFYKILSVFALFTLLSSCIYAKNRNNFEEKELYLKEGAIFEIKKLKKNSSNLYLNNKSFLEFRKSLNQANGIDIPHQSYFENDKIVKNRTNSVNSIYALLAILTPLLIAIFLLKREKEKRPIKELPLDVRIGGVVDLESLKSRFELNKDKFKMVIPKTLKGYITAIGKIKLDENMLIYNVYVSENINSENSLFTLKLEVSNGVITVVKLLTLYDKIYPRGVKDWEKWLDGDADKHPIIGDLQFTTKAGIVYKRVWENGVNEAVRSKFIENLQKDSSHFETLNIVSLYGRDLGDGEIEFLYLSNIEDYELNNFVKVELGIAVRESELLVY